MKKLRAFLAVPVPTAVCDVVTNVIAEIAPSISGVRWVEPEGLHITLKFFGEIEELQTVEISRCVQRVAANHAPFDIALAGLGAFPAIDRPRTLWAGVTDGADSLIKLQTELEDELDELGYKPERRRYHPHLTIGRVREKSGMSALTTELQSRADIPLGQATIDKAIFYSSELRRDGPIYTPLATCPLG